MWLRSSRASPPLSRRPFLRPTAIPAPLGVVLVVLVVLSTLTMQRLIWLRPLLLHQPLQWALGHRLQSLRCLTPVPAPLPTPPARGRGGRFTPNNTNNNSSSSSKDHMMWL